jgi:hypothetical protein
MCGRASRTAHPDHVLAISPVTGIHGPASPRAGLPHQKFFSRLAAAIILRYPQGR